LEEDEGRILAVILLCLLRSLLMCACRRHCSDDGFGGFVCKPQGTQDARCLQKRCEESQRADRQPIDIPVNKCTVHKAGGFAKPLMSLRRIEDASLGFQIHNFDLCNRMLESRGSPSECQWAFTQLQLY
jgi:hypothetical protein